MKEFEYICEICGHSCVMWNDWFCEACGWHPTRHCWIELERSEQ